MCMVASAYHCLNGRPVNRTRLINLPAEKAVQILHKRSNGDDPLLSGSYGQNEQKVFLAHTCLSSPWSNPCAMILLMRLYFLWQSDSTHSFAIYHLTHFVAVFSNAGINCDRRSINVLCITIAILRCSQQWQWTIEELLNITVPVILPMQVPPFSTERTFPEGHMHSATPLTAMQKSQLLSAQGSSGNKSNTYRAYYIWDHSL